MRPVIHYQSQLLYRKSYKPNRIIRIRPAPRLNLLFRALRRGLWRFTGTDFQIGK